MVTPTHFALLPGTPRHPSLLPQFCWPRVNAGLFALADLAASANNRLALT